MATKIVKREKFRKYSNRNFFAKFALFWAYKSSDVYQGIKNGDQFTEYGTSMYCGRQGAGKSVAMTEYLERMREKYPKALIVTNYNYRHQHHAFKDWNDFFQIRNGTDGVIFAIDEIQNEFNSKAWNSFPESLLSEITQQRKQRIKIVCTSQIFTRVAKPLREQCNDVIECVTFANRWTFTTCFDAVDYNTAIDSPTVKQKVRRLYRKNFVQDSYMRTLYDTFEKIERISRTEFQDRETRNA